MIFDARGWLRIQSNWVMPTIEATCHLHHFTIPTIRDLNL